MYSQCLKKRALSSAIAIFSTMSGESVVSLSTQMGGFLGVGAEVRMKEKHVSFVGDTPLLGLVMKSAPNQSWIVYWFDLDKTSCSRSKGLIVVSNPSQDAIVRVGMMSSVLEREVDFSTDILLKQYLE